MTPSRKEMGGGGRQAASPPSSAGVVRSWREEEDEEGEMEVFWPRGLSFHQEAEAAVVCVFRSVVSGEGDGK